jgi:hypothetical protein
MADPMQQINAIIQACSDIPAEKQQAFAAERFSALLADIGLNPTGDDPEPISYEVLDSLLPVSSPAGIKAAFAEFRRRYGLLQAASHALAPEIHWQIADAIVTLVNTGYINAYLVEKFRVPENRKFLNMGLTNAGNAWQLAMVANWALNAEGMATLSGDTWRLLLPALDLNELVGEVSTLIRLDHVASLRDYRRQAMRHVPKLSGTEFAELQSQRWQAVIDLPSGRSPGQDIPLITPFIKQGDIEYSLYRHYLVSDLSLFMRNIVPAVSAGMSLTDKDIDILFSLPIVIQQVESEVFSHVKTVIADIIRQWAQQCRNRHDDVADALRIAERIWNYQRSPAASDCNNPVENLIKGFTATTRNTFSHFSDINIAASCGDRVDPYDVAEKFVLFASVSNGQLNNLAEAHRHYCAAVSNPSHWDNEQFFSHFLAANQRNDLCQIQAHFIVDKTRGCPAIPQIPRFHGIVLDLVLEFVLREFGEENLRQAGTWYLREKTPTGFN